MDVGCRALTIERNLIPPSHRRRGATAVLVRHKPQWHRHDRSGSIINRCSTAETVKTEDLRGGTAETLNMFKTSAVPGPPRLGPIRSVIASRSEGGFPNVANVSGRSGSVPVTVSPLIKKNHGRGGGGFPGNQKKTWIRH